MIDWIQGGGWPVLVILLLGGIGIVVAATAITVGRSGSAGYALGGASALLGLFIAAVGVGGWWLGRRQVDEALAFAALDPTQLAELQRLGYEEASRSLVCGGAAAAVPVLAGGVTILLASRRSAAPR